MKNYLKSFLIVLPVILVLVNLFIFIELYKVIVCLLGLSIFIIFYLKEIFTYKTFKLSKNTYYYLLIMFILIMIIVIISIVIGAKYI